MDERLNPHAFWHERPLSPKNATSVEFFKDRVPRGHPATGRTQVEGYACGAT
jgi:hypothetical protein